MGPGSINPYAPSPASTDYEPYDLTYGYDAVGNFLLNEEYSLSGIVSKMGAPDLYNGSAAEGSATARDQGAWRYDENGSAIRTPQQQAIAYTYDGQPRHVSLSSMVGVHDLRHGDQRAICFRRNGAFELDIALGAWEYHERTGSQGYTKCVLQANSALGRHAQTEFVHSGNDPTAVAWYYVDADHLGSANVLRALRKTTAQSDARGGAGSAGWRPGIA